ncbi:MAG: hypothetical protein EBQ92_00700 [Proteobacteria bacterium]|nr:hypothetical protein [Pseudomonadota bacterium]
MKTCRLLALDPRLSTLDSVLQPFRHGIGGGSGRYYSRPGQHKATRQFRPSLPPPSYAGAAGATPQHFPRMVGV